MRRVSSYAAKSQNNKGNLQCSARPIFTCYENMAELKSAFLAFAYEYYEQYVSTYRKAENINPYLILPLSYIEFAGEEPHLFKLLFIDDMDLEMTEAKDFYKETDNEKRYSFFRKPLELV